MVQVVKIMGFVQEIIVAEGGGFESWEKKERLVKVEKWEGRGKRKRRGGDTFFELIIDEKSESCI